MSKFGLTDDERKELADSLGYIVTYFVGQLHEARGERDALKRRVSHLEGLVAKYRSGVLDTAVAVQR